MIVMIESGTILNTRSSNEGYFKSIPFLGWGRQYEATNKVRSKGSVLLIYLWLVQSDKHDKAVRLNGTKK